MIQISWGQEKQHSFLQNKKWWLQNPLSVQPAQYSQTYLHFETRTRTGTFCAQTLHSRGQQRSYFLWHICQTHQQCEDGSHCDRWRGRLWWVPWHTSYRLKAEPTQEHQRPASVNLAPQNCTLIAFERRAKQTSLLSELWVCLAVPTAG